MIFLIIAVNLSITLLNIYIAIRIWQLRLIITRITSILINYESYFSILLPVAPQVIYQGQDNIAQIRQQYQLLQLQTAQIRQLFWLLNQSYQIWRRI
ncbi:MAG: hypothetical protein KME09_19400 [Pleurocapsa minor HA4230-MV1]|jgi:hypothetical protein|nr:hypothetical protein [Pleurocapsa minor HA4230-MV1]